jgi:prepilin-type N-terminal cleavage/methylation domain-containing protein
MKARFAFPYGRIVSAKTRRWGRGYTLIELLVVIVIISVLTSLIASQVIKVLDDGNRLKTRAIVVDLKTGISSYRTEYGRFPLENLQEEQEWLTDGSSTLIDTVLGLPVEGGAVNLNAKGIRFAEFPTAKNDRHGLISQPRPSRLVDMWGNPFRVLLDADGNNQVKNPDAQNSDPNIAQPAGKPAPEFLALDIAIYSCGKDGLPRTADDIVSWREP